MVRDRDAKHRRLAAIVFTDIVGFSALVNRNEALGARALDRQRRVVRRMVPAFGGREIETAGDSFLLVFTSAFAALRCVVAIQQALKVEKSSVAGDPPVLLRASVHLGDIEHRGREVFGDGVNIAARLMPMSPEGGVAISDQVHSQIRHRLDVAARSLGACELKNIRHPVEVFVLDAQALAAIPIEVPGAGSRKQDDDSSNRWQSRWLAPALLLAVFVSGIGVLVARAYMQPAAKATAQTTAGAAHRRLAVLPFSSFSPGDGDALLASGLQDSVLTNLARIEALRVTSRTSVMQYKDQATRNLKAIASELGVDAIVEGSLQRNGDRLLVQVQLIDAGTDQHLWAQSYDRNVTDLFEVESAIAREVAGAVKVQFSAPQRNVIDARPTSSVAAYAEYQRAVEAANRDYTHQAEMQAAVKRALELDPDFALAHILQAELHVYRYWANEDRSETRLAQAKQELIRAAELRPDLPELHRGWGNFYFNGRHDVDAAAAEYEAALRLMPNDAVTLAAIGAVYQEQDRLPEALLVLRRAVELDPRSMPAYLDVISTLELMRNFEGASRVLDALAKVEPKSAVIPIYRARLALETGDVERVRALMKTIDYAPALERLAYYLGDLDEAIRQMRRQPEWQDSKTGAAAYPIMTNMAVALWLKGERAAAKELFRKVAAQLEAALKKPDPAQWDQRTTLAISYAAIGRAGEARALIRQVREEDCCKSPNTRADILCGIAFTSLLLGDRGEAITAIDRIVTESSAVSWQSVAIDPAYRELHGDPAFEALLDRARRRAPPPAGAGGGDLTKTSVSASGSGSERRS